MHGVKNLLIKIGINGLALWVATLIVGGVTLKVSDNAANPTKEKVLTILIVACIFALVNTFIKPLVMIASFGLLILTLGLVTFVINALMLLLTSKICEHYQVRFHVDSFGAALLGSLVITVVSVLLHSVEKKADNRR
jgi:putative membrane protein